MTLSTLVVTAAIIEHEGKVLLTKRMPDRPYGGLWEFPGGKVEPGEDPKACVVREISEELDITIEVVDIFDTVFHRYPERDVLLLVYRCRWLRGTIRNLEVAGHHWVAPVDLLEYELLPADIPLVEKLGAKLA